MSLAKMHSVTRRAGWGLVCASIAAVTIGTAVPASAAEVVLADLDRGVGCAFALKVVGTGDRVVRKFTDAAGNPVRELSTGKGFKLTFTNKDTGQRFTLPSNGSVSRKMFNADGSYTEEDSGHNVLILFPSDVPAGPSTTLYVGRVVFTVSLNGVFTLLTTSGRSTDICALL